MPELPVEYRYIDRRRLLELAHQLGIADTLKFKPSFNFGLSLTGPEMNAGVEMNQHTVHYSVLAQKVIKKLNKSGHLTRVRPANSLEALETKLCLEEIDAIKVIFPPAAVRNAQSLKEIAVWFSEPVTAPEPHLEVSPHRARGTYLYLIEAHWDTADGFELATSGYSALQKVFLELGSLIQSPSLIPKIQDEREELRSPVTLLRAAGGVVQTPRRIRALYRPRLFSDDQYVEIEGVVRRSYDLFAYPLFIALI